MLKLWLRLCGDTGLTLTDESVEELHSEVIYIALISQGDIQVFVNRRIHSPRLVQLNEFSLRRVAGVAGSSANALTPFRVDCASADRWFGCQTNSIFCKT